MRRLATSIGALALACSGKTEPGGGADTEPSADADTDTDTDADTDTDTDTEPAAQGLLVRVGNAIVDAAYTGTEDLELVGDDGYGEIVCAIHYDLASVAVRDDCSGCEWAFDVAISNAETVVDASGACTAIGYDATAVAALNGTTVSRGYNADYAGHAQVLMVDIGGTWQSASYGLFDEGSGAFSYEWEDGFVPY
jgi:hypothetical protein